MIFSDRLALSNIIDKWCEDNGVKKGSFATITYLHSIACLNEEDLLKFLKEKGVKTWPTTLKI